MSNVKRDFGYLLLWPALAAAGACFIYGFGWAFVATIAALLADASSYRDVSMALSLFWMSAVISVPMLLFALLARDLQIAIVPLCFLVFFATMAALNGCYPLNHDYRPTVICRQS